MPGDGVISSLALQSAMHLWYSPISSFMKQRPRLSLGAARSFPISQYAMAFFLSLLLMLDQVSGHIFYGLEVFIVLVNLPFTYSISICGGGLTSLKVVAPVQCAERYRSFISLPLVHMSRMYFSTMCFTCV